MDVRCQISWGPATATVKSSFNDLDDDESLIVQFGEGEEYGLSKAEALELAGALLIVANQVEE